MTRDRVAIVPLGPTEVERRTILEKARRRGFSQFVLPPGDPFVPLPGEELFLLREGELVRPDATATPIPIARVGDPDALTAVVRAPRHAGPVVIEWTGDRVIPLENAIATLGGDDELWVFAHGAREVPGALGALEHGARRVLLMVRSVEEIDELEALLEGELATEIDWLLAPVTSVRPAGVGDRVLVDTTSLLDPEEGLLVGSAAAFLFHVASEAIGSRFSGARPFRVNAGAAHSYVLMADGTTRYLAELAPGDPVLACRPRGDVRAVRVGRIKVERRPLVVISAEVDGHERTVFLQEAETVRISTDTDRVSTTRISSPARVFGARQAPARHLGTAVEETILER